MNGCQKDGEKGKTETNVDTGYSSNNERASRGPVKTEMDGEK